MVLGAGERCAEFPAPAERSGKTDVLSLFHATAMNPTTAQRIPVIDSHTAGEPTRVIVGGVREPEGESMLEKRASFARDLDWLRTASVCEPRGHEAMVGALLCAPVAADCVAGVIFFNNVGTLNGCLHGTMGLAVTLAHLGKIGPGSHRIDTVTGVVTITVGESGAVTVRNVPSYRYRDGVTVEVPGFGAVSGEIAWGGNWFFLTEAPAGVRVHLRDLEVLTEFSWSVKNALQAQGITGENGAVIDHVEVFGPPADPALADSKNFVMCPGKAYDRSPCGTGTSAKLACLHAAGKLAPGGRWRQSGILDSVFEGGVEAVDKGVIPTVTGTAWITAEADLLIDPAAPFAFGIPSPVIV